jgi:hypothetical protein
MMLIECLHFHRQSWILHLAFVVCAAEFVFDDDGLGWGILRRICCWICCAEYEWVKEASQSLHVQPIVRFRTEQGSQILHQQDKLKTHKQIRMSYLYIFKSFRSIQNT